MDGVPAYQTMMPDLVIAMQKFDGAVENPKIVDIFIKKLNLTGKQIIKLQNDLRWARTYLNKIEMIKQVKRGCWILKSDYRTQSREEIRQIIKAKMKEYYSNRP